MVRPKAPLSVLLAGPDEVELEFYDALQNADLERLMALWVQDDKVRCIHPGSHEVLIGATAIRASFAALFARGPVAVQPAEVQRLRTDQLELHQVRERVLVPSSVTQGEPQVAWVLATNAFLKTSEGWRMVLHHASPGGGEGVSAPPPPPETHLLH